METLDRQFQYSHVTHPRQMYGTMTPFRPHWSVQHVPSGQQEICNTRQKVFKWIKEWYDICGSPRPYWLIKEIKTHKNLCITTKTIKS